MAIVFSTLSSLDEKLRKYTIHNSSVLILFFKKAKDCKIVTEELKFQRNS